MTDKRKKRGHKGRNLWAEKPAVRTEPPKPPRSVSDQLVLQNADQILPGRALLIMLSGTALAAHLARLRPDVIWHIHTMEHFYLTSAVNALSEDDSTAATEIEMFCTPDLPEEQYDTVILATNSRGSSELLRETLQAVAQRMKPMARLIITTNNAKDHWLHELLKSTYGRTTVRNDKHGICYVARKATVPGKLKSYDCEFAFRDEDRLIRCFSRPGVFSHRRVDGGARALIRSLNLYSGEPGKGRQPRRIVEMGCGAGAVATATALRFPQATVLAVDSHARAVQSTERTAAMNSVTNVSVLLTSDGQVPQSGSYDLFLGNPPYYSDFRISELFLQSAAECLKRGGYVHIVTKSAEWHENRMIELFANAQVHRFGEYDVVVARR